MFETLIMPTILQTAETSVYKIKMIKKQLPSSRLVVM